MIFMRMTGNAFWGLLQRAAERPGERERTEFVVAELQRLPRQCTADFHRHLHAARVDTPGLRAAARIVLGRALSDDAYWDFHLWLLSLGRAASNGPSPTPTRSPTCRACRRSRAAGRRPTTPAGARSRTPSPRSSATTARAPWRGRPPSTGRNRRCPG
ncbi:DUF4240 domain-containing protein [Actinokineospora soli]|uniref:DUF4240 domain-containing protein n=1 Tax=Actinokineospora soli TaxID=1048753 RepID=A0ABW2TN50_9PSEU